MFSSRQLQGLPFRHQHHGDGATLLHVDSQDDSHWDALERLLIPDVAESAAEPLRRVFAVVRGHGCEAIVIEHRYVDLDFRSEYATFWAERFEDRRPLTRRLHFFACELTLSHLYSMPKPRAGQYLGYSVLRPTLLGPVGRTILRPPADLEDAVLTRVIDTPSLFGNDLPVEGVPYCQQDGELLRCAHAAAWICHYVAWRNGVIGRRFTGDIARMASPEGSAHRPLPSAGLSGEQLQGIFSAMQIPAIYYFLDDLPELSAPITPPDTRRMTRWMAEQTRAIHARDEERERVLRVVCKYLNSGFPVVVLSDDPANHAFTLVGWRHTDYNRVELIACDDQQGPYERIADPLADEVLERGDWWSVMLPLPSKVYLSADGAEIGAINMVLTGAARANGGLGDEQDRDFAAFAEHLEVLDGPISIRTRLLQGRRFKAALDKSRPAAVRRLYRMAHLPQYVWLVEFQDREARRRGDPPVLAEVVLDSTSHERLPVPKLSSTQSMSKDASEIADGVPPGLARAKGPNKLWDSLITGRRTRGTGTP
jgi:hypothetical protein